MMESAVSLFILLNALKIIVSIPQPIPNINLENQNLFIHLTNYLLFLNATNERRTQLKELINYLDRTILDCLVYELYLKEKLGSNLMRRVETYLVDIEGMDENEKLAEIEKMVERLKNDEKVEAEIEKIKNHEWVKIIERKEKEE